MSELRRTRIPIRAVSLSMEDVRKIFERLNKLVVHAGQQEATTWLKSQDETQEAFEQRRTATSAAAYRVTVTITGTNGEDLFGDNADLFASPQLPDVIQSIYMTNTVAFAQVEPPQDCRRL